MQTTIRNGFGLLALLTLTACASQNVRQQRHAAAPKCLQSETLTCDRFADDNYNCSCQKGANVRDILDSY